MLRVKAAYIAGFFDGEGSILLIFQKRVNSYILKVTMANTDRRVLDYMKEQFGGSVCGPYQRKQHHTPFWSYELQGRACMPFIRVVQPYSVIKREQIDIAIEMIGTYVHNPGRGHPLPEDIKRKRQLLKERLHKLKTKGHGLRQISAPLGSS